MSRIKDAFRTPGKKLLNVYCTAGFPSLTATRDVMLALQDYGASMIEIGMPYSDPLADGPVIQQSSAVALDNGMTIPLLFEQLKDFRSEIHLPVILMGYMNPVLQFGFENFCRVAAETGIDGLIIPDLPEYEFEKKYGVIVSKYGLDFIFLVTPETSPKRIARLDALSSGFLYAVSASGTTGHATELQTVSAYLDRLQQMKLQNPVLVGFGIHDRESFDRLSGHAAGAIIGSAYIKALQHDNRIEHTTQLFLRSILKD